MKIILYVLDSLRSDHLSCYGYNRKTSPNIDKLANEGVLFQNAFAPSTWTRPNAASILTGCYPLTHGVETMQSFLSSQIPRLPTILKENRYVCAAFSAIVQVSKEFGFADGFDHFVELFQDENLFPSSASHEKCIFPTSEDINKSFFSWLQNNVDNDFFSLVWSIDTHVPYAIPFNKAQFLNEEERRRNIKLNYKTTTFSKEEMEIMLDLYDSCIYYNDQNIGVLCDWLKQLGIYDDTLIIIIGDHGEIFNEHIDPKSVIGNFLTQIKYYATFQKKKHQSFGRRGHLNVPPYDIVTKIPLIIKFPNNQNSGRDVNNLVSLIDLAPTITQMAGVPNHINFEGRSLIETLQGTTLNSENERIYFSVKEIYPPSPSFYSIRSHKWKYVMLEPPVFSLKQMIREKKDYIIRYFRGKYGLADKVLYNLSKNDEGDNVIRDAPEIAKAMNRQLQEWRDECRRKKEQLVLDDQPQEISEAYKKQLKDLGYF